MKNYVNKFNYLECKYGSLCPIAKEQGEIARVDALHHRHHQTKWARKKFPLFIDSMFNLMPVNNAYHLIRGSYGRISELQAMKYEMFLQRHPKIAAFVNGDFEI